MGEDPLATCQKVSLAVHTAALSGKHYDHAGFELCYLTLHFSEANAKLRSQPNSGKPRLHTALCCYPNRWFNSSGSSTSSNLNGMDRTSLAEKAAARIRKAQAVPGMEQLDVENAPVEEHEVYAPGLGRWQKKSLKRDMLKYIDQLRAAVAIDHWREAHRLIVNSIQPRAEGMLDYMTGKTPVSHGEQVGPNEPGKSTAPQGMFKVLSKANPGRSAGFVAAEKGSCSGKGGCGGKDGCPGKPEPKKKKEEKKAALGEREAIIRHEGNEWVVRTHDGNKVLGRHSTREKAAKQLQAIEISKHGG